jgi:hypothetical protein
MLWLDNQGISNSGVVVSLVGREGNPAREIRVNGGVRNGGKRPRESS